MKDSKIIRNKWDPSAYTEESRKYDSPEDEIINLYNEIEERFTKAAQDSMSNIFRIGEIIFDQKKVLPHGEFTPWVNDNLPFGVRQAQRYILAYLNKDQYNPSLELNLKSFLALLKTKDSNKIDKPKSTKSIYDTDRKIDFTNEEVKIGDSVLISRDRLDKIISSGNDVYIIEIQDEGEKKVIERALKMHREGK
ncbi:hypothetical protein [Spirochaeta cellobiosiphila]|uniref:hypothetical protein n=1 Tax=Spirochaeta cellobiosiphila TaxID=504483 RepID=UPI000404FA91|nr:hypothetical protein [Spirochaeta cellobiosiphila]